MIVESRAGAVAVFSCKRSSLTLFSRLLHLFPPLSRSPSPGLPLPRPSELLLGRPALPAPFLKGRRPQWASLSRACCPAPSFLLLPLAPLIAALREDTQRPSRVPPCLPFLLLFVFLPSGGRCRCIERNHNSASALALGPSLPPSLPLLLSPVSAAVRVARAPSSRPLCIPLLSL